MSEVKCTKCGAPILFDSGDKFAKCRYCDTQIYIDKSSSGFFYIMPFFIDKNNAEGIFKRWASGPKIAKGLASSAIDVKFKQQFFPLYIFKRDLNGKEALYMPPARSTTLPGLHRLKLPAGDIKIFDQNYDAGGVEILKPDLDMGAYLKDLPGTPKEQALLYFPVWSIEYGHNGKTYNAVIDGSSGEVFASGYPKRNTAPLILFAAAAFLLFFIESIPMLVFDAQGLCCGGAIALMTIPAVIILANYVLRRY
jgi:DNA-directed RNA polymerase subunit RPC12/RpoP